MPHVAGLVRDLTPGGVLRNSCVFFAGFLRLCCSSVSAEAQLVNACPVLRVVWSAAGLGSCGWGDEGSLLEGRVCGGHGSVRRPRSKPPSGSSLKEDSAVLLPGAQLESPVRPPKEPASTMLWNPLSLQALFAWKLES